MITLKGQLKVTLKFSLLQFGLTHHPTFLCCCSKTLQESMRVLTYTHSPTLRLNRNQISNFGDPTTPNKIAHSFLLIRIATDQSACAIHTIQILNCPFLLSQLQILPFQALKIRNFYTLYLPNLQLISLKSCGQNIYYQGWQLWQ